MLLVDWKTKVSDVATITTSTTVEVSTQAAVLDGTNALELMATFNQLKATIAELKKEQEKVDTQLRELLNGADAGTINGVVRLKVEHRSKSFADLEMLKTNFSEVYEKVKKSTPWSFLKTL